METKDAVAEIDKLCESLSARVFPGGNVRLPLYSELLEKSQTSHVSDICLKYADEPLVATQPLSHVVAILQKLPKHKRIAYMLKVYANCNKIISELKKKISAKETPASDKVQPS